MFIIQSERRCITMKGITKADDIRLLNEILEGASELPLECQEQVLLSIRTMIFTKKVILKKINMEKENKVMV